MSVSARSPSIIDVRLADGSTAQARAHGERGADHGLLFMPAMGTSARNYDALGALLAERGWAVLVGEWRGIGSSSLRARRGLDFGYADLFSDFSLYRERLVEELAPKRLHLGGHSLGAQLATLQLAIAGNPDSALFIVAAGTVYYGGYPGLQRAGILAGTQLAALIAASLGYFPGHRLGFGGRQARTVILDWAEQGRTGTLRAGAEHREEKLAAAANPVLAINVEGDAFAPSTATEHLLSKLPRARVTRSRVAAPTAGKHSNPHFSWLERPEPVAEAIAGFVRA